MKKLFIETNAETMVAFADENGRCYVFTEQAFDERLTLDVAKQADYSNCDNCETAEEIMNSVGTGKTYSTEEIIKQAENVTEF